MATVFWKPGVGRLRPVLPGGKTARITAPGSISLPSTLRAGVITTGQLMRQPYDEQIGSIPIADGQGWRFPLPKNTSAMTDYKRRVETQWQVDGQVPHYKYGSIVVHEFTVNGSLGAAAQPTTQDHWHVVSQLYGPSDNPGDMWGPGFVSHGVSIKNGKITFSGGGAHPGQEYTQSGTYEYGVDLADYVDGKDYRIKVVALLADEADGWFSVWCNGVLWSVGEQWHPEGMWNGIPNGNRTGVMWTKEPWNYTAMRNGIYRGTNSGEADRPIYDQSVKITVHYLSPGTQTPAAESAIPRYMTTFADNFAGSLAKWTATDGVTIQGGAMSLRSDAAGSSASTTEFAGEASITQTRIASRPAGDAHQAAFRVQDAVTSGNMAEFAIKGASMKFRVGTSGQADPAWISVASPYDWYTMQYVRLRESEGVWRFETSIDGFTWRMQGSAPSSWMPGSVRFVVSAAMVGAGSAGALVIDDVQSRQPEEIAMRPTG